MDSSLPKDPFQHTLPGIHESVRKSELMVNLHEKLSGLPAGAYPFASELGRLRDIIAPQIADTRILFPEFTPHDEPNHVAKLYSISDKFFGSRTYKELNTAELFLLAAALYAHDWGMAVGSDEKLYLQNGAPDTLLRQTFSSLPDEKERLDAFVKSQGLLKQDAMDFPILTDNDLRLYVRITHARRSGARARSHFVEFPAIGEALARICEGHWHDFATLDDPERFPRQYEVAGETTNLLALALQIRLIDLFHITDDRTPFALWRFVSPTDKRSAEEWKKHRSLHGVTVVDYHPGRAIKVQGFTENEEVWAGLQDLQRYCSDQVRKTLDISARHVPKRYGLDFLNLEWDVPTGHLRPVDFRFGFDRSAMFKILSDDIYNGDQRVFLRELLQNSIDAIKTRRAKEFQRNKSSLKKKTNNPSFDTTIYFSATHNSQGDIALTCRDYGIGMDEHIIKHYFTVAGVSYYRSNEFQRQHLGFEPISRFGVGVLSCFMVADSLHVKTYRDPECMPAMAASDLQLPEADEFRARRLDIEIPGVQRQFIVRQLANDFPVGTEVKINISSTKLAKLNEQSSNSRKSSQKDLNFTRLLEITEFLCEIAGFVEFPIIVEERWPGQDSSQITLILHPDEDAELRRSEYSENLIIHQLSRSYPWHKVTGAESLSAAADSMTEHRFEMSELSECEGYEGWIVFPKPINEDWDFTDRQFRYSFGENEVFWRDPKTGHPLGRPLRWTRTTYSDNYESDERILLSVYRDGILLAEVTKPFEANRTRNPFPPPLIRVNLPGSQSLTPNVARTTFSANSPHWDEPIWPAIEKKLLPDIEAALELPIYQRVFKMGWLISVFQLNHEKLSRSIPKEKLVSLWITQGQNLELREGLPELGSKIAIAPTELSNFSDHFTCCASHCKTASPSGWNGPDSLMSEPDIYFSIPARLGLNLSNFYISSAVTIVSLQFLTPPSGFNSLLRQFVAEIHQPSESYLTLLKNDSDELASIRRKELLRSQDAKDALNSALTAKSNLTAQETQILQALFPLASGPSDPLFPISFSAPFCSFWATHDNFVNLNCPLGVSLMQCLAACAIAELDHPCGSEIRLMLKNLANKQFSAQWESSAVISCDLETIVSTLFTIVENYKVIENFSPPDFPTSDKIVPKLSPTSDFTSSIWGKVYPLEVMENKFGNIVAQFPLDTA